MYKFFFILKQKFTIKSLLSLIISITFALVIKYLIFEFLHENVLDNILSWPGIFYCTSVAIFRIISNAVIEAFLGETHTLFMDNNTIKSPSKDEGTTVSSSSQSLSSSDAEKLNEDMSSTLKHLHKMNYQFEDIKKSNDVKLIVDKKGGLNIDAPSSISDDQLHLIRNKVHIADRIYNTQLSHYQELLSKDKKYNGGYFGPNFNNNYNTIVKRHREIFDYE